MPSFHASVRFSPFCQRIKGTPLNLWFGWWINAVKLDFGRLYLQPLHWRLHYSGSGWVSCRRYQAVVRRCRRSSWIITFWKSTESNQQKFTLGLSLTALDLAHIAQSVWLQLNVCLQQNAICLDSEAVGKRHIFANPIKVYLWLNPLLLPLSNSLRTCFMGGCF